MINKIRAFVANVKSALEYRAAVNETIRELSRLTNHELNDIGISRCEIYSIAHHTHTLPKKKTANDFVVESNPNLKGFV